MAEWTLNEEDLKHYRHFDADISAEEAVALATSPQKVAQHAFYPFIHFEQFWNKFAKKGKKGKQKTRKIRFSARRDSYIFSYYRHLISEKYESELEKLGLSNSVLAYRRIPSADGKAGKCNINFAKDAFQTIRRMKNCSVAVLDISDFFGSLDHQRLKEIWCQVLGFDRLPDDHFAVFKAITNYAYVEKQDLYERLGYFGDKWRTKDEKVISGYTVHFRDIPRQLCNGKEFREKIANPKGKKSIIKKNRECFGIPQGAPISDVLANLYLMDFDVEISELVNALGGVYFRYSDDILVIVPGGKGEGLDVLTKVRDRIKKYGEKLFIKEEKSSLFVFKQQIDRQDFTQFTHMGNECEFQKNGLEYLGFRYDGHQVYLRDSTLANYWRKVTKASRREAIRIATRYPDKSTCELKNLFNYESFIKQYSKVEGWQDKSADKKSWTFWTYAKRASYEFGELGKPIIRQLRRHDKKIRYKIDEEIGKAVCRRIERKSWGRLERII